MIADIETNRRIIDWATVAFFSNFIFFKQRKRIDTVLKKIITGNGILIFKLDGCRKDAPAWNLQGRSPKNHC